MLKSAKRPKVPSRISENISVDLKNQSSISAKADRLINLLVARNKQRLITLPFVFQEQVSRFLIQLVAICLCAHGQRIGRWSTWIFPFFLVRGNLGDFVQRLIFDQTMQYVVRLLIIYFLNINLSCYFQKNNYKEVSNIIRYFISIYNNLLRFLNRTFS